MAESSPRGFSSDTWFKKQAELVLVDGVWVEKSSQHRPHSSSAALDQPRKPRSLAEKLAWEAAAAAEAEDQGEETAEEAEEAAAEPAEAEAESGGSEDADDAAAEASSDEPKQDD